MYTTTPTYVKPMQPPRLGRRAPLLASMLAALLCLAGFAAHADTVASLLGDFTINQYCGLKLSSGAVDLHYVIVYGQLPALRELHAADADANGVTTQAERDAYFGKLAPTLADQFSLIVDGAAVSAARRALGQQLARRTGRLFPARRRRLHGAFAGKHASPSFTAIHQRQLCGPPRLARNRSDSLARDCRVRYQCLQQLGDRSADRGASIAAGSRTSG